MKFVPTAISRVVAKNALNLQTNAPGLLFGVGIVGVVATAVLASKATLQVEDILVDAQKHLANVDETAMLRSTDYTEQDIKKDKAHVYLHTAKDLASIYWPAVLCGSISIAALTKSHSILNKRNAGLTAAYAAMDRAFTEYRRRVRDEVGEDRERELMYPLEKCEIDVANEDGTTSKKEISVRGHSQYAKLFGRHTSASWSPQSDFNIIFLRAQQNWANQRLHAKGYLFLNEVYDALGLDRTPAGQVVGWTLDQGDGYVDFGIFDSEMEPKHLEFFLGHEDAILLDFNVAGVMYKKIEKFS